MALRNAESTTTTQAADKPATTTPAFEGMDEDNTAVMERPAEDAPTTTAVTTITKSQLIAARPSLDKNTLMRGLKNAIPPDELEGMGIGVFPRITASQGGFVVDKNVKKLGQRIRFEVLSWNYIWMVVTGEQNNAEANKLIRSSYDNVNISGGGVKIGDGTVKAYVDYLKADGYDKTSVKQYIEVYGNLLAYEEQDAKRQIVTVEVPADEQKLYQVSLSPQSVGQWGKYQLEGSLRKARGFTDDALVTMIQREKTLGPNTFAYAEFEPKW